MVNNPFIFAENACQAWRLCKYSDEILLYVLQYLIWFKIVREYLAISPLSDSDDFLWCSLRLSSLSKFCVSPENRKNISITSNDLVPFRHTFQ